METHFETLKKQNTSHITHLDSYTIIQINNSWHPSILRVIVQIYHFKKISGGEVKAHCL